MRMCLSSKFFIKMRWPTSHRKQEHCWCLHTGPFSWTMHCFCWQQVRVKKANSGVQNEGKNDIMCLLQTSTMYSLMRILCLGPGFQKIYILVCVLCEWICACVRSRMFSWLSEPLSRRIRAVPFRWLDRECNLLTLFLLRIWVCTCVCFWKRQ